MRNIGEFSASRHHLACYINGGHSSSKLDTNSLFSVFHFSPSKQLCFWCYTFFCRHHRTTAAAVAKRNEPRTLLFLAFTSTRMYMYIYFEWRRKREKIMSNLIFSRYSAYAALWEYSILYTQLLLILYGHFICDFLKSYFFILLLC